MGISPTKFNIELDDVQLYGYFCEANQIEDKHRNEYHKVFIIKGRIWAQEWDWSTS